MHILFRVERQGPLRALLWKTLKTQLGPYFLSRFFSWADGQTLCFPKGWCTKLRVTQPRQKLNLMNSATKASTRAAFLRAEWPTAFPRRPHKSTHRNFGSALGHFDSAHEHVHERVGSGFIWFVFICSVPRQKHGSEGNVGELTTAVSFSFPAVFPSQSFRWSDHVSKLVKVGLPSPRALKGVPQPLIKGE